MKRTNKMMKRLAIMAILMTGLLLVGTNQAMAQQTCPDTLDNEAYVQCWRKKAKSGEKNLRLANLSGDLQNIDLSNADLTLAQMANENLSGANFSGANLTNANLGNTNLTGANFKGANLTNAFLGLTNLTNADFTGAIINGISFFGGAKIGGAKIDLTPLQCKVTTKGNDLNLENEDGTVVGSLKNGTIVYQDGNIMGFLKGRTTVNQLKGDEFVSVEGLVDGKSLTCNSPLELTSDKIFKCKVRTKGSNLNARTLAGKLKFTIKNSSEVYVFEQKDERAKVSVFNDDNEEFKGWVPLKYLNCDAG